MAVPLCARLNGHGVSVWCFCELMAFIMANCYCGIVCILVVHIVPVIAARFSRHLVLPVLRVLSRADLNFSMQHCWGSMLVGNALSVGGLLPSVFMFLHSFSLV